MSEDDLERVEDELPVTTEERLLGLELLVTALAGTEAGRLARTRLAEIGDGGAMTIRSAPEANMARVLDRIIRLLEP